MSLRWDRGAQERARCWIFCLFCFGFQEFIKAEAATQAKWESMSEEEINALSKQEWEQILFTPPENEIPAADIVSSEESRRSEELETLLSKQNKFPPVS